MYGESAGPAGPVLVTGATGNVGREVVRALQARGIAVRAGVAKVERAREATAGTHDLVRLDFTDPATWPAALDRCGAVFLMRPPAISRMQSTLVPFLDAARSGGADQVVFLSVAGAGENRIVPHHAVEVALQESVAPFTVSAWPQRRPTWSTAWTAAWVQMPQKNQGRRDRGRWHCPRGKSYSLRCP